MKTDLQEDGLIGLVQTVRIETAQFSNQSGQWVEGSRELSASITYNIRENRTEGIGSISVGKAIYTYDAQGHRIETVSSNSDGFLSSKLVHTYDAQGHRTETVSYGPSGSLLSKTLYTYDTQDRLIEQISCDTTGCFNKMVYTYDDQGNLTGVMASIICGIASNSAKA